MMRRFIVAAAFFAVAVAAEDMRNIETGWEIPSIEYADQPYIVVLNDGTWVCTITTGLGHEGKKGQHIISARSTDKGRTWSEPVPIEPHTGPEASWVCPLLTDFGRIYAFYTYNGDEVHIKRDDTHGWYAFKYSDDGGRTWCAETHRLPYRITACDQHIEDGQVVPMFWGIDKPIVIDGTVYFAFTKLGRYFLENSEGWLFKSDNIMTEPDLDKFRWEMLPEGEHGIRHPEFGSVQEEHNLEPMNGDGNLVCVYRTTQGFPAISYSFDSGANWTLPEPMRYTPGGRIIRNPRACPKLWRCENGKYLFWFHNHGGKDFNDRNPVWIIGGIEKDGIIHWSQPEILLYHDDVKVRMSYPDLLEVDGQYYVTETQKAVARVHLLDTSLLEGMWAQVEGASNKVIREGLLFEWNTTVTNPDMPELPNLTDGGWTIEVGLDLPDQLDNELVLVDTRDKNGKGIAVTATTETLRLDISDGTRSASWDTDPGLIQPGGTRHVVFIVDGGPDVISVVVDGRLCDGNMKRQWGFGRIPHELGDVTTDRPLRIDDHVNALHIYNRYLTTAEAVSNYRATAGGH